MPAPRALALIAVALVAAGCGGSDNQENRDQAREAAEHYVQALKDGDGEGACEVLTRGAVQQLEDEAGATCPEALARVLGAAGPLGEQLDGLKVTEVNVSGRVATATIRGAPGGAVTNQLTREGDEWKLTSPGG